MINTDLDALRESGKLKKSSGDWMGALLDFEQMLQEVRSATHSADHIRSALFHSADCLLNTGRASEASKRITLCLKLAPDHSAAPAILTRCQSQDNPSKDDMMGSLLSRTTAIVGKTVDEILAKQRDTQFRRNVPQMRQEVPCHLKQLYIRWDGRVFPCCRCWADPNKLIGNLKDPDLFKNICEYNHPCQCERYKLRQGRPEEMDYGFLNIEMSLACNAKCAMCCVDAPAWRGVYDLYDNLYRLVNLCKPKTMLVQGGEILIQKSSLEWLERVHEDMPSMKLWLVTNGNVELSMMERMEKLFDKITISILGFQMETYRTITGLEFFRMKELAEKLIQRGNVSVIAKFLYSPISIHEIPLFLEWIAGVGTVEATINDASTMSYLNMNTDDNYWNKIAERTAKEIKRTIVENADNYRKQGTRIGFDTPARATFHIDDKFLVKHELGDILYPYLS